MLNELANMISEKEDWSNVEYQYYFSGIIVSLCNAIEARRTSDFSNYVDYEIDERDFKDAYYVNIAGTYQDHLADAYMMVLSFSGHLEIDIEDRNENRVNSASDSEIYYLFNRTILTLSKIAGYERMIETQKQLQQTLVVDILIYIESLAARAGKDIHWHVANKLAYNGAIENESNNNG